MTISAKRKAVAYVRISSMRQIDNESPATQRDRIQQYAEAQGIEVLEWFFDEAKSGKNADREELQNLLQYALKYRGKIDHVIVYSLSRASRDTDSYYASLKAVLKTRGITIRSVMEPMVDDSKMGRFMETMLVALAQLDNDGKSEYTKDNMKALAAQGYWQNAPMLGYDNYKILNEIGQPRPTLKQNAMAPKVKTILERFSEGDITKAELTRFAADIGLRSRYGKKLSEDSINRLLKHPIYAGFVTGKLTASQLVEGKHAPVISKDTFERNQALLYGKNSRKDETHLKLNSNYPLKGLILCHNCTKKLYASAPTTGNGSSSPRYHCARPSCKGLVRSVKARQVHDDFEDMLQKIKPAEGILRLYKAVLVREAANTLGRLNQHIETLRSDLTRLDSSRINAIQKFAEGEINAEEKKQLTDLFDTQKLEKVSELKELEQQQNIRETDIEFAINVMDSVDKQWIESDLDIRVRFQKMLFPEGLIYDSLNGKFGTSAISPLYRYTTIKKDSEESLNSYLVAGAGTAHFNPGARYAGACD